MAVWGKCSITCCKDCPDREPGCHGHCETYIQQRKELDEAKAEARRRFEVTQGLNQFRYDGIVKVCKQRNYRSKFRKGR